MHIGLIGGIGPAATDFYYRRLIATFASKKAALELTIVHADTPTLLSNLASNNAAAQVAIYVRLRLALMPEKGWQRRFDDPIPLPNGRELVTLEGPACRRPGPAKRSALWPLVPNVSWSHPLHSGHRSHLCR
jgi:hypothetical protein